MCRSLAIVLAAGALQLAAAAPYAQYFADKFKDHEDAARNNGVASWTREFGTPKKLAASDPLAYASSVVAGRANFWSTDAARTDALRQTYLNVPTLTMHGKPFVHVDLGATYIDAGAKCVDFDPEGKLESFGTLKTTGTVDANVAGEYKIFYDCRSSIHPNYSAASAMRLIVVGGKDPYHNAAGLPSACAVGQYAEPEGSAGARRVRCSLCPPGRFNDAEGATSCKQCPRFTYQFRAGQNACKHNPCRAGQYLDMPTEACQPCPPNTYSNIAQLGACTPCGTNKMGEQRYSFGTGGAYERACASSKCLPGTYQRQGRCDACPINTHQPFWGQLHCIACPDGMRTPTVSGNVRCVDAKDALTSEEVLSTYLKPRTCSDITCSITNRRVYTSTQHRWPYLDATHNYAHVGHRLVIHHGKEGGKALGHNQVNELHGVHHRCAMHDNYQACTCMCWYTPPKYDQWKAIRGNKGELSWSREERMKLGTRAGTKRAHQDTLGRIFTSSHMGYRGPDTVAKQSELATSWRLATSPDHNAGMATFRRERAERIMQALDKRLEQRAGTGR